MATMFGDVTDLQRRHHQSNIPHLVKKIKGFPLKAKSFRNIATYQKPKEGGGGWVHTYIHAYTHTCFIYLESYTINSISTISK